MSLHPQIHAITERIRQRSAPSRAAYLAGIDAALRDGPFRSRLSCGNLAHAFAACGPTDKSRLRGDVTPNLGIITAYNDMLSAHQPFEHYPDLIRACRARELGATAQVAGGVPAMCDGVTQGRGGMELSLFSRDVIAQATAIGLSHDMFDATVYLGVCDKIVPGLLIGALAFGHLPAVFVPAGPMTPGIPNKQKAEVRERYAAGEASREELLEAEAASYHAPGTCTFYGTANSNQVLLEAMGVQLPGASFVNPEMPLRDALTRAATERALRICALGDDFRPIGSPDRRARHRQRRRRPDGHRRLDQPHHPLDRGRARGRHRPDLGRHGRDLADRAAVDPRLSQRRGRREPLRRRRRYRLRVPRTDGCRA